MTRAIEVEVWEFDFGLYSLQQVGTLTSDSNRQYLDDLRDTGSFSLEIQVGHADEALCTPGRFVRFVEFGSPTWWGVIEPPLSKVSADPRNRRAGRVITVQGRGALAELEWAPIYPELGLGRISPDTRYFNFASLNYDASAWGNAVELKQQSDPDNTKPWFGAPKQWPDPNAWWIGPTDGDVPPVDPGDVYFRGTFTVASGLGGEYRFFLTADDGFELYVDGDKVTAEQGVGLWGATRYVDLLLDEGSHLVGVKAINFDRPNPSTNVFGFIMSVYRLVAGGQTIDSSPVSGTSSGTKMLALPATAPGMTPGKMLTVQFDEMFSVYLYLDPVNYDFDATNDSNGDPWPKEIDLSFPVGTSTLEMGRKLIAEKACDLWVDPVVVDFLTVKAFIEKGDDLTGSISILYGDNIGELVHDAGGPGANAVLSRTAEGRWVETSRSAAVSTWGKRGTFLSQGSAPSNDAAIRQAEAYLDDNAEPQEIITKLRVEPVGPIPHQDFFTGDTVTVTAYAGGTKAFRVTGIHTSEDEAGQPIYELDLEEVAA